MASKKVLFYSKMLKTKNLAKMQKKKKKHASEAPTAATTAH